MGRFLEADPIGFNGGMNFYRYVGNNPVNMVDPFGLCGKIPWWDFYAKYKLAQEIADELLSRNTGWNDVRDVMRHAEWSRRTAEETDSFTAWSAGVAHKIEGYFKKPSWISTGQYINESRMDLHNNAVGRDGTGGTPMNVNNLVTNPNNVKWPY